MWKVFQLKYSRNVKKLLEGLKKKITKKGTLSKDDLLLIQKEASVIKNSYSYSEQQLETLFTELETLKQTLQGLENEKQRIKQFLQQEYSHIL